MLQLKTYSTDGMALNRRIKYWNDITRSAITRQVATPVDRLRFRGRMTCLDLGDVRLVEIQASGSTVTCRRAEPGYTDEPFYLVRLVISGEITTVQNGRVLHLKAGDFSLYDTSRSYEIVFKEGSDILLMRIPPKRLLQYIARPEALLSVVMRGDAGLSGLASRHLRDLWGASQEFLSHGASARMLEMTMQLLASAGSAISQAGTEHLCVAASHRARILQIIEGHLSDPELTPATIATRMRVTPSYLHRLFSGGSDTISRHILRRRLDECAQAFKDPRRAGRSITAIAFAFGFSSLPHFSRVFRQRYELSPREFRNARP